MQFVRARRRLCQILTVVVAACGVASAPAAHAGEGYFTSADLTLAAGAPPMPDGPTGILGWATPWDNGRHVAYASACVKSDPSSCGETGIVVASSYGSKRDWTWVSASAQAGPGPKYGFVLADSVAYPYDPPGLEWARGSVMIIKGDDFHIWQMWTSATEPAWHLTDLTALTGSPRGSGITAYVQGNAQHVVFRSEEDGALWELIYTPWTGWKARNLSVLTGTTNTWMRPAATILGDRQMIAYENRADNRVHLLVNSGFGWSDQPISANTAAQDPFGRRLLGILAAPWSGRVAVTYCDEKYRTHELSSSDGTSWKDLDLSQELDFSWQPCPIPRRSSVALEADGSERLFIGHDDPYWTPPGDLNELVRDRYGTRYRWVDRYDIRYLCAFSSQEGSKVDTVWIAYRLNDHVIVEDMTVKYT
ncbi:hypothetical protein ACFFX1_35675 [Dactylosporangium sucinum]|uniref:Uncharacterized protein n=1 Tax=Dactylosporangium sucinum TaxID=1424081 RepID=A0A917X6Y7_9ACTN|nr:hypothetical protein [Dactylosporangium sucinum]GGM78774.1 hypothetical protein GCM10007977_095470 [Dactylosporangium sucinum]